MKLRNTMGIMELRGVVSFNGQFSINLDMETYLWVEERLQAVLR